jgi:hypothetical protein
VSLADPIKLEPPFEDEAVEDVAAQP